jgi:MFS family permease
MDSEQEALQKNQPEFQNVESALERSEAVSFKYQNCTLIALFLCGLSIAAFGSLLSYQTISPEMLCAPKNDPKNFTSCNMVLACSSDYISKVDTQKSIVNWMVDYNLICSRSYISEVMSYIYFGGCILSAIIISPLADKFGRKAMLIAIMLAYFLVTLKAISSDDFISLIFVLIASGLFTGSYYNIAIMHIIESTSLHNRGWYASLLFSSAPIGGFIVAPLIGIYRDWKLVSAIISVSAFILTISLAFTKNSPRYYIAKNEHEKATESIGDIIYWNSGNNEQIPFKKYELSNELDALLKQRDAEPYNFLELFKYQTVSPVTYVMIICSFLFNNMYLGMVLNSETSILSSTYSAMISAASDFLSCIFAGYLLMKLDSRGTIVKLFHYLTCVLAVAMAFFGWIPVRYHAIAFVFNRFLSLVALDAAYLFAIESFPTRIRGMGIGLCSVFANLGKLLAYLVTSMGHKYAYIFGVVGLVGFLTLDWLPEIKDMGKYPLSDDADEIEVQMSKKN